MAVLVLAAWAAGLTLMVRREFFAGSRQRLAEAALRIVPGALFYVVERNGEQVGFASTTLDTMPTSIEVADYLIADVPLGKRVRRSSARSVVKLSRALSLRTFETQSDVVLPLRRSGGRAEGDSAILFARGATRDSQRVAVVGPVVLPTVIPLVIGLGEQMRVNRRYTVAMFNPITGATAAQRLTVTAESLFTVVDSATLDPTRGLWVSALRDTVRAWLVTTVNPAEDGDFSGWVDASGRVVETTRPDGLKLRRMAYEMAFENWRIARDRAAVAKGGANGTSVLERTAIAAGVVPGNARLHALTVRLTGADLRSTDVNGDRQTLTGDTLRVTRDADSTLTPDWTLLQDLQRIHREHRADLGDEALLQAHDIRILSSAVRIVGPERDARRIVERLTRWVHDSLAKRASYAPANALEALRTRRGDCQDHAQLFVAFARALGVPARLAGGVLLVGGKFYQHAWAEVWLRGWVAVDPTFNQFPSDAAHIRLVSGGAARQAELLRTIGNLDIHVITAR